MKEIPGFYPYFADSVGRIYHLEGDVPLKTYVGSDGYPFVWLTIGGVDKARRVHKLVALAFLGERPDGMVVCHNDGDRKNNAVSNLRYDTPSANTRDSMRHGTFVPKRGEKHGHASITDDDARTIKNDPRPNGMAKYRELASKLGTTWRVVQKISLGYRWQHA